MFSLTDVLPAFYVNIHHSVFQYWSAASMQQDQRICHSSSIIGWTLFLLVDPTLKYQGILR
jgi:hypothetical protein